MAAKKKAKKRAPARRGQGKVSSARKKRPAPRKGKPRPRPIPVHVTPVPKDSTEVVGWFQGLSARIDGVSEDQLRALIQEAKKFDLVGLAEALGSDEDAVALNRAANTLLDAAIAAAPPEGERAHLLSVLRDILNDS
ncbi:MAG: hypothetical protein AB1938_15745 [Myxococcota bacterium]